MLEHARRFIERVMPPLPEGQPAYLNIHWASPATNEDGTPKLMPNGKPMKWWDGRACSSIDEAIKTIAWVNRVGGKDIYLCMSLQRKLEEKTSSKGHAYKRALRLAEDAVALRSLFIDVDVKPDAYPTTRDALAALKSFLTQTSLPIPSAVVASGSGGFHAHWALDQALPPDEWQVLANALAAATQQAGLLCDTQCTVDSARILRVPETKNYKSEEPTEVTLLSLNTDDIAVESVRKALAAFIQPLPPKKTSNPSINDDLGAGLTAKAIEPHSSDVARNCGFVARTLGTGGKDNTQPLWFLTAALAGFMSDGKDAFHTMSDGHPGYSAQETDQLFDRVKNARSTRNIGWPQCSKIAAYGAPECATCPLLQHNKSPLNYATPAVKDKPDDTLPEKYGRNDEGIIIYRHIDDNGAVTAIPICHYPITSGWLSNNPWTFHFTTKTETGRTATVELPTEVIFAKDGFNKYMGAKGFFLSEKQYKILKEFFVAWLQKLQASKDSVISAAPFGWSVVDGKIEGFTYANRVWMKGDDRPAANPNPVLHYQYSPKGEISAWADAARIIYEQDRPALNAILAVAFAAPLVRFTGFDGLILNAYSAESGIGKTTAMKVSQSVWANPVLAMQGLDDTANSVLGKMGQLRSLPMYWDEIKSEEQVKRFCSIVFNLTGGREKTRMNADATLKLSGTWQTMMVSASNDSIVDGMARVVGSTTAGLHRLFEYSVPKPATLSHDLGSVQRLLGRLSDNYGHAGLAYAKFLGSQWQRVEQEVAKIQDDLYNEVQTKQEERMWIATIAVVLKGAEYANELGLTAINVPELKAFMLEVLEKMRGEVDASPSDLTNNLSVSAILAEFLNSTRSRNTLITNRVWVGRGKPKADFIKVISDTSKLGELAVQIGKEDGIIRISSVFFSRWMADRGYSRHTFMRTLEKEFNVTKVNGKLAGGTDMTCAMEHIIELDMNDPKLQKYLE